MPGYFHHSRFFSTIRKFIFCRALYLLSIHLLLFPYYKSCAQRAKIDSLIKTLPFLHDSARIDCLNVLSLAYTYLNADTAKSYAQKSFSGASAINYLRGMAMSLNNEARIAGLGLQDFQLQEKISLQTIQLYKNLKDEKVLAETYMNLALALFCQSYFERSAEACNAVIQLSQKTGDKKGIGEAIAVMGSISLESGNYEKSFEYFNQSLEIFKSINDSYNTAIILAKIGDLYRLADDHKTALNFYFQSLEYPKGPSLLWHPLVDLGDSYYSPEQYDSAMYDQEIYNQTIKSLTIRSNYITFSRIRMAEMHIATKEYDKALTLLIEDLEFSRKRNDKNQVMRLLLDIGRAYEGKKDYGKAFYYTKDLLQNARKHRAKQYIRDGYKLMYMLHHQRHHPDSAYSYLRQYTSMKDSVAVDEFSKKLAIYKAATESEKKQAQIELLNKENLINQQQLQINGQQLKSESFLKNILFSGVLVLVLIGFIIFRNIKLKQKNEADRHEIVEKELKLQKLESERTKSELQQQATELEMQALRAQMNPHFIFNSLNSINRFILQNNRALATEYLTKFSRLVRLILQNSQSSLIPMESELEALQLYLELEAVRFNHHFRFNIRIDAGIDVASLKVPPLIIQPYAENAIWHGLMHKKEKGHLQIELYEEEDMLCCKIADDGVGRKKAVELKSKSASTHKSMGMQITANRIAMLQKEKQSATQIKITDLVLSDGTAGGTEVLIKIPVSYD
ncbi:MAG: tetratricopeptide repeat-containing sensor histidine kinase [Chitinophagaceae bacterium]